MRWKQIRRLLIGNPLRSNAAHEQHITNPVALAVLSSDALSSVSYATEAMLLILMAAGSAGVGWTLPISVGIGLLLVIVGLSYCQTILEYPQGGGAFTVASENLGALPGMVAGSALLVGYILTVAVSVAESAISLGALFPVLEAHRVAVGVILIAFLTGMNLRGVKESGAFFSVPTYIFLGVMTVLIVGGIIRFGILGLPPAAGVAMGEHGLRAVRSLSWVLLMRAFVAGCSALTGVEAIANGVPVFHPPQARNAAKTLLWMVGLLGTLFLGVGLLQRWTHALPQPGTTLIGTLARAVYGEGLLVMITLLSVSLVLFLAANTAYADFPRLSSIIAQSGYLPRQFKNLGDRLVFSNGIVNLSLVSGLLLVLFQGATHHLLPLYAVAVFLGFTLSQTGMVVHSWRKHHRITGAMLLNSAGALVTGGVTLVSAITRFLEGAWMVVAVIPILIIVMQKIHQHYEEERLVLEDLSQTLPTRFKHRMVVAAAGMTHSTQQALRYAKSLNPDFLEAVHVAFSPEEAKAFREGWKEFELAVPLTVLTTPYRSLIKPLLYHINRVDKMESDDLITVVVPQYVPDVWWKHTLHNQSAALLRWALMQRPNTVVVTVPFQDRPKRK